MNLEQIKTIELVRGECQQIISVYKNVKGRLWRGINTSELNTNNAIVKKVIRPDRNPVETPMPIHQAYIDVSAKLGLPVHRGNGIFTSPFRDTAAHWGMSAIVFPKDGFKFVYFTKVETNYLYGDIMRALRNRWERMNHQELMNAIEHIVINARPKTDKLEIALSKRLLGPLVDEVLVGGEYYYGVLDEAVAGQIISG